MTTPTLRSRGPAPRGPAIEARSLTKLFDDVQAVDNVSFHVPSGAVTGLIGANGSGKTTTMRMLLGLIPPTAGEALVHGRRYAQLEAPRHTVGAVIDRIGAHPGHTARQHLTMVARSAGLALGRVSECLDEVGLLDAADRPIRQYSMGMEQRCALAAAVLGSPPILILDEPANGLDPAGIRWLRTKIRGWADEGRAVLVSTHQLAELALVVDRLVVLHEGRVIFNGAAAALADADQSLEDAVFSLLANPGSHQPTTTMHEISR